MCAIQDKVDSHEAQEDGRRSGRQVEIRVSVTCVVDPGHRQRLPRMAGRVGCPTST